METRTCGFRLPRAVLARRTLRCCQNEVVRRTRACTIHLLYPVYLRDARTRARTVDADLPRRSINHFYSDTLGIDLALALKTPMPPTYARWINEFSVKIASMTCVIEKSAFYTHQKQNDTLFVSQRN